jgi:hypothetical protein
MCTGNHPNAIPLVVSAFRAVNMPVLSNPWGAVSSRSRFGRWTTPEARYKKSSCLVA